MVIGAILRCLQGGSIVGRSSTLRGTPRTCRRPRNSSVSIVPRGMLVRFVDRLPTNCHAMFGLCVFRRGSRGRVTQLLKVGRGSSTSRLAHTGTALTTGMHR